MGDRLPSRARRRFRPGAPYNSVKRLKLVGRCILALSMRYFLQLPPLKRAAQVHSRAGLNVRLPYISRDSFNPPLYDIARARARDGSLNFQQNVALILMMRLRSRRVTGGVFCDAASRDNLGSGRAAEFDVANRKIQATSARFAGCRADGERWSTEMRYLVSLEPRVSCDSVRFRIYSASITSVQREYPITEPNLLLV